MADKSLMDNVSVDDKSYKEVMSKYRGKQLLVLSGACPKCGRPIYAKETVYADEQAEVKHTCSCNESQSVIGMQRTT